MNIRSSKRVQGCGKQYSQERGAALIIALSVFLVLLSLAITFSIIVRYETQMTHGATSRAQAERLLDGAIAQAQYRLNLDAQLYPDAMSLDHGWRTWFNGAAFAGKSWARAFQGEKAGAPLWTINQGLVSVNIEPVERVLRSRGVLPGGILYAFFPEDQHCEPLFRGPRTEAWINIPRRMGPDENIILLPNASVYLFDPGQGTLTLDAINNALNAGSRPERFEYWTSANSAKFPYMVPREGTITEGNDGVIVAALPQETVNFWADVDNTGDGMTDSIWLPMAREVNHFGDGIDNMLTGTPDPANYDNGEFNPLFESAPFVYNSLGLPEAVRSEDLVALQDMRNVHWAGRHGDNPPEMRLFLTVPLPNLITQVDLNNDGIFDERDFYEFGAHTGPVYVQLPSTIYAPVIEGQSSDGLPLYGRVPLTADNVDAVDNDYDLVVNSFRSYAFVGPHNPLPALEETYNKWLIPYSTEGYTRWLPFQDPTNPARGWHAKDQGQEAFSAAYNRAYHDINVDAALGGPDQLRFFLIPEGDFERVSLPDDNDLVRILRQPNALHISCSGEPVSEIIGRYAVHISDESSKVDLNAAGAYIENPDLVWDRDDVPFRRSLHLGRTPFEYDTRLLPYFGDGRSRQIWNLRTGALADRFNDSLSGDDLGDAFFPGYGMVDDNGNALLLALSGWDEGGRRLDGMGLQLPDISAWSRDDIMDSSPGVPTSRLARYENTRLQYRDRLLQLGRFDGIDEPAELHLYNPLKNHVDRRLDDRLFLRKEELRRHRDFGVNSWEYVRNLVTTNSERRNIFHVRHDGNTEAFYQLDPNTATPQQLAAMLMLKADVLEKVQSDSLGDHFMVGLRQFDTAFIGDFRGSVGNTKNLFPASPMLQLMRLAVDIAAARTPQFGIRRLSTENTIRNERVYSSAIKKWVDTLELGEVSNAFPREPLNERERILDKELFPVGDLQEMMGAVVSGRGWDEAIMPDIWWKSETGEDRLIQYTASSLDAIRINEIMVRPVRRVEAEMANDYVVNVDPAPVAGMLTFEMDKFLTESSEGKWHRRSAYDHVDEQPLLGDRTAWVYDPEGLPLLDTDLMEFRFRVSEGLPEGRYYLTVNLTDQFGRMTVNDVDVLEYAIKYVSTGGTGIAQDYNDLTALMGHFEALGLLDTVEAIGALMRHSFQSLDAPEYFTTEAMRLRGSASPVGWAFLPNRLTDFNISEDQGFVGELQNYLGVSSLGVIEWDSFLQGIAIPKMIEILGCPMPALEDMPVNFEALIEYLTDYGCLPDLLDPTDFTDPAVLNYAWLNLLRILDSMYNSQATGYFYDNIGHTVMIRPETELSVALRMNPVRNVDFDSRVADYIADPDNVPFPYPVTVAEYRYIQDLLLDGSLVPPAGVDPEPVTLAVNFFDFSQEPSHEYLELANVSDEEVDLSGWVLEVGIPDPPGATHDPMMIDPYKSQWAIPDGTKIAAQGYLLLGVDRDDNCEAPLLSENQMGLFDAPGQEDMTVPPIENQFFPDSAAYPWSVDDTGSVFRRLDGRDYIDNDGDGLSSQLLWNTDGTLLPGYDYDAVDTDHVLSEVRTHGFGDGNQGIPAGKRIIQLENRRLWKERTDSSPLANPSPMDEYLHKLNPYSTESRAVKMTDMSLTSLGNEEGLKYLAQFILRGGVFPNYPERDGIDNDGDGGYVVSNPQEGYVHTRPGYAEDLLSYVPGALDKDMVDNNLNGVMDNRGYEVLYTGPEESLIVPRAGQRYASLANPLLSEGVDEGRLGFPLWYSGIRSSHRAFLPKGVSGLPRFYGPGSYEAMPLSLFNLKTPAATAVYRQWANDSTIDKSLGFNMGAYEYNRLSFPVLDLSGASGKNIDSPDWQAFLERRWNPGDNVIVTLYVGNPSLGVIADQVSYNELDVINRTKDDIVECPYRIDGFSNYECQENSDGTLYLAWRGQDGLLEDGEVVCLAPDDPGRHSFWLPDHMGLDFYRSLERKHPLYHGDRFGSANRWTATDGIYDDWAESLSLFETVLGMVRTDASSAAVADSPGRQAVDGASLRRRFVEDDNDFADHALQLYGHAFYGSPLRMNTQARHWENPPDLMQLFTLEKEWRNPAFEQTIGGSSGTSFQISNQRYGRQFAGLDAYRNTGHNLDLATNPANDQNRRLAADWAVRRAKFPKKPFATLGDMLELPFFSFEQIIEGPSRGYSDGDWTYTPQYAVSVLNTGYFSKESKQTWNDRLISFNTEVDLYHYGVDRNLTSGLLSQAVYGGGASLWEKVNPDMPLADLLSVSAMNPVVLTVGQAQVVPLWPAPGARDIATASELDRGDLLQLFQWKDGLPPHMWTPVYLFNLPNGGDWDEPELPWQQIRYPRMIDVDGTGHTTIQSEQTLSYPNGAPLIDPVYLFNGKYIGLRMLGLGAGQVDELANIFMANRYDRKWPVRSEASLVGGTALSAAQTDRAAMYVSRVIPELGKENRPEVLFVWDRETGLENGDYIAYVGTFIPGLKEKLERASDEALAYYPAAMPTLLYDGDTVDQASKIRNLDPTHPKMLKDPSSARFAPKLAMEFITDRRAGAQMYAPGVRSSTEDAMSHPWDWLTGPDTISGGVYSADPQGYVFYSDHPTIAWRPVMVRVEDNYLALRVRNMGNQNQVACITHVVLAPAPRTHGVINVNTAETQRVVRGVTGNNWTIELFNALFGLPGVVNALNVHDNFTRAPYSDDALGLPKAADIPKSQLDDPWRKRWQTKDETDLLDGIGSLPPPVYEGKSDPLAVQPGLSWTPDREGYATLRLSSLIASGRPDHYDGRYYENLTDLLRGSYVGGMAYPDDTDGPWPLSNLGLAPQGTYTSNSFMVMGNPNQIASRYANHMERRHDEIMKRFSKMSNLVTTRSNVFEIIATVQTGSVSDLNSDGVMDYRGDEFFPEAEARGRVIYDLRNRPVFQDQYKNKGL